MFLPVKSVGVMGDGRTYDYVVALRAVQTSDFMTADWAELPYALLKKVSSRIINEVRGINRVTYDVSAASRRPRLSGSRLRERSERHPAGDLRLRPDVANACIPSRSGAHEPLRIRMPLSEPPPGDRRGFAVDRHGHFIFVTSPGFQVFVSAGSVGP